MFIFVYFFTQTDSTRTVQRSALCRSWLELSNAVFVAKFGLDTADNEPFQVCPLSSYRSSRYILEMQSPQGRYELTNRTLLEMNEEQQRSFKSTVERIRGNLSVQRHRSC